MLDSAKAPAPIGNRNRPKWIRSTAWFLTIAIALILLWEGYKAVWTAFGWESPIRPGDSSMPHVWDIVATLFRPARRGGEDILLVILLRASLFTLREAFVGFIVGGLLGFAIAVAFVHSRLAERSLMPYVVASQTVPIIAIAPMVVLWAGRNDWPQWIAVAVIASYLTFFPVTINTLRGLKSPETTARELLRSYAATRREVLWKLRVPAALPYIFTALKISATASVIGAIIGELPAGFPDGLGRVLLNFSSTFITFPEKLYATVLISALAGIAFVAAVAGAERLIVKTRPSFDATGPAT